MPRLLAILLTLLALPLCACQTITHGTTQLVEFRTEPAGASVTIPGYATRVTPAFMLLERNESHTVQITKEGFKPYTTTITAQLAPGRATPEPGVFSVLGSAIDAASGGSWELNPDKLTVKLEPVSTPAAAPVASAVTLTATPKAATPAAAQVPAPAPAAPAPVAAAPAPSDTKAVLADQLARLDKLLSQGVITQREHDLLTAAAISAAAMADAPSQ